jgi:hypothetical protein
MLGPEERQTVAGIAMLGVAFVFVYIGLDAMRDRDPYLSSRTSPLRQIWDMVATWQVAAGMTALTVIAVLTYLEVLAKDAIPAIGLLIVLTLFMYITWDLTRDKDK